MDKIAREFMEMDMDLLALEISIDELEDKKAFLLDKMAFAIGQLTDLENPSWGGLCEKSPIKRCIYDGDNSSEPCVFCHKPETLN